MKFERCDGVLIVTPETAEEDKFLRFLYGEQPYIAEEAAHED